MTKFIKTEFKILDDQTMNITEYRIISKLKLQRIIISKFMMIRQLFHVKKFQVERKNLVEINS